MESKPEWGRVSRRSTEAVQRGQGTSRESRERTEPKTKEEGSVGRERIRGTGQGPPGSMSKTVHGIRKRRQLEAPIQV